jgi:hypothetical protein
MKTSDYRSKDGNDWIHIQPHQTYLDFINKDKYKFSNLHLSDYLTLAAKSKGMILISTNGKPYNLFQNYDPLDHFAATAMKEWNYDIYDQLRGFNKLARPERMFFTLLKYCKPVHTKSKAFNNPTQRRAYKDALHDVYNMFSAAGNFKPLHYDDMLKNLPTGTSAGYEFLGKKKEQVKDQALRIARQRRQYLRYGYWDLVPYKFAMRGHLSPIHENKSRPVWVTPFSTVILENYMFRPIYEFIFNNERMMNLILTGKNTLSRLRKFLSDDPDLWYTNTDFSSWDSFRSKFLLQDVLFMIKKLYIFDDAVDSDLYDRLIDDYTAGAVAFPNGYIYKRAAGIPTGTLLTLLMNSMANFVIFRTTTNFLKLDHINEKIVGDDYGFKSFSEPNLALISFYTKKFFDMEMHPDKCLILPPGTSVEERSFIGYKMKLGRLDKDGIELLKHVLYPESHVNSANISFTRIFSYYILGGISSPLFVNFFERFIGGYEKVLRMKKGGVFDTKIMHQGNLRVFKHVFRMDFNYLNMMSLDDFFNLKHSHIPYHLTHDMKLV